MWSSRKVGLLEKQLPRTRIRLRTKADRSNAIFPFGAINLHFVLSRFAAAWIDPAFGWFFPFYLLTQNTHASQPAKERNLLIGSVRSVVGATNSFCRGGTRWFVLEGSIVVASEFLYWNANKLPETTLLCFAVWNREGKVCLRDAVSVISIGKWWSVSVGIWFSLLMNLRSAVLSACIWHVNTVKEKLFLEF